MLTANPGQNKRKVVQGDDDDRYPNAQASTSGSRHSGPRASKQVKLSEASEVAGNQSSDSNDMDYAE